jgi:hypothetical protein
VHNGEPVEEARRRSPTPTSTSRCSSTTRAARRAGSASAPTPASASGPSCARPRSRHRARRRAARRARRPARRRGPLRPGPRRERLRGRVLSLDTIAHALQVPPERRAAARTSWPPTPRS